MTGAENDMRWNEKISIQTHKSMTPPSLGISVSSLYHVLCNFQVASVKKAMFRVVWQILVPSIKLSERLLVLGKWVAATSLKGKDVP